jgi:hypothetical protein
MSKEKQDKLPDPCKLLHTGTPTAEGCNNATPGNNVNDSVFPGSKFLLRYDSLTSYSWVKIKNGDSLMVIECGCSYITTTLLFTTRRYKADTNNIKYWYKAADELMAEAAPGLYSAAFNYDKSVDTLKQFIKAYPDSLKFGRSIHLFKPEGLEGMSADDAEASMAMIPSFSVDGVSKLSNDEYTVTIEFNIALDL